MINWSKTAEINRVETKPCPFCGCTQLKLSGPCNDALEDDLLLNSWQVVCFNDDCHIAGPSGETQEEAIRKWNERRGLHVGPFKTDNL